MHTDSATHVLRLGQRDYDLSARTLVMGVLNVTPDSFSDGGKYLDPEAAVKRALEMFAGGADIIDIGGESTRPKSSDYGEGAEPVSVEEEIGRVVPVIELLVRETNVPVSVDTYKSAVARRALEAGASIVNDISGFRFDPEMARTVAEFGAAAVLMHIRGTPKTMQQNPEYDDLVGEITDYLRGGLVLGGEAGVQTMIVDPGIGFGKTVGHNLELLNRLDELRVLGVPILVGPSRKSFIGALLDLPVEDRLEGSLAATVAAVLRGANIVRVHDVREAKRALIITDAIRTAGV